MKTNYLTTYPTYHIQPINLSSRSPLYSLEPQGLATPYVESLSSYVQRIAKAHCVATGTLISKKFAPVLNRKSKDLAMLCSSHIGKAINGMGKMALDMLKALEVLTLRNDLHCLTLQPFANVIHPRNLWRRVKAWCPVCLEEWRNTGQEIYEPLLWSIQAVETCPLHLQPLQETCNYCDQSAVPVAWYSRPGHCSKCYRWLGKIPSNYKVENSQLLEATECVALYNSRNIGNLLANSKNFKSHPSREILINALLKCIDKFNQSSILEFAKYIDRHHGVVRSWVSGKFLPSIEPLLHICFCFNLSLTDLFSDDFAEKISEQDLKEQHQVSDQNTSILGVTSYNKDNFSNNTESCPVECSQISISSNPNYEEKTTTNLRKRQKSCQKISEKTLEIQSFLENIIRNEDFKPLDTVAEEIGVSRSSLRKHFSSLYKQIAIGYSARKAYERTEKLRVELERLALQPNPPAPHQAAKLLKIDERDLRKLLPDLCNQLVERRTKYRDLIAEDKTIQVTNLLENFLQDETEPPLPLIEIARSNGYHQQTLMRYAPDLCKKISSRYLAYKKKNRELKIKQACDEVRDITLKLYLQGIYPNTGQVTKLLSVRGYFREEEVVATWKATLKELYGN